MLTYLLFPKMADDLPEPAVLAAEIVEDLEAALEQSREIADDLGAGPEATPIP